MILFLKVKIRGGGINNTYFFLSFNHIFYVSTQFYNGCFHFKRRQFGTHQTQRYKYRFWIKQLGKYFSINVKLFLNIILNLYWLFLFDLSAMRSLLLVYKLIKIIGIWIWQLEEFRDQMRGKSNAAGEKFCWLFTMRNYYATCQFATIYSMLFYFRL